MAGSEGSVELVRRLAQHVVGLPFARIPEAAVAKAKAVLLHDIAVAFGGVSTKQARLALDFVEPREPGVTIIGHRVRAGVREAALVNAVLVRALRMEDVLVPSFSHPGATLIPAALAIGERERATGREVLAALVVGYDVLGRIAGSLRSYDHADRAPHHLYGVLGTAAVAARLLRLDVDQAACALAYAANLAVMITHGFQDFQYGLIAYYGVMAAELGRARAPYPADALEGPRGYYASQMRGARPSDAELLGKLGIRFEIMNSILKPHPCTGGNLVALELTRCALRDHGLASGDVLRVRVTRSGGFAKVSGVSNAGPFTGPFGGMYEATSSLPFALANVLLGQEISPATFENPNAPHLAPEMQKVAIDFREDRELLRHELEIETVDGRKIQAQGAGELLRTPDVAAFLKTYAYPVVGAQKADQLQHLVEHLETAADLDAMTACLV